jgi:sulfur carrier protein
MRVNGVAREGSALNVRELLDELGYDGRGIAVARNGEVIPRSLWAATIIDLDDVVEIVTAAAGG